jgi:hypothetical protein
MDAVNDLDAVVPGVVAAGDGSKQLPMAFSDWFK